MTLCELTARDTKAKPYMIQGVFTGSSRKEESDTKEELDRLFSLLMSQRLGLLYRDLSRVFRVDVSSVYPCFETENEIYLTEELSEEEIIGEMIESDFIVRMSPMKEYTVRVRIKSTEKAVPRIVEPEGI